MQEYSLMFSKYACCLNFEFLRQIFQSHILASIRLLLFDNG